MRMFQVCELVCERASLGVCVCVTVRGAQARNGPKADLSLSHTHPLSCTPMHTHPFTHIHTRTHTHARIPPLIHFLQVFLQFKQRPSERNTNIDLFFKKKREIVALVKT